jgi:hypothetical protein
MEGSKMGPKTLPAAFVAVLLLSAILAAPVLAEGEEITVKGEVLDLACYLGHGAKGAEHAACAAKCVKGGQPMGLLTADGKVYLLVASHKDAAPFEETKEFAGQEVEIRGNAMARDGISAVEVLNVKKL